MERSEGLMAIAEDGYWGELTSIALQTYFGQKARYGTSGNPMCRSTAR